MKINKVILSTLFACVLVSMASCVRDDISGRFQTSGVTLEFTITTNNSGEVFSRATEAGEDILNENKIDKLDLFFCASDGSIYWYVEDTYVKIEDGSDIYTKKVSIDIPQTRITTMNTSTYDLHAVINGPARTELAVATDVSDLQALTVAASEFNHRGTPANFLMTGEISTGVIDLEGGYTIGTPMELIRAASKIRLLLKVPNILDFEMVGTPEVRMVNYVDETSLVPGAPISTDLGFTRYKNTEYEVMGTIEAVPGIIDFYTNELPFYTYENDWTEKAIFETRLIIKAVFKSTKAGTNQDEITYFYNASINSQLDNNSTQAERNVLYEITAEIAKLGSTEENLPIYIDSYVTAKPWPTETAMDGVVVMAVYLVVKEKDIVMPNIPTRQIEYISSLPVTITNLTATYTTYNENTGAPVVVTPGISPSAVGTTTGANDKTFLVINNPVPINFVPLIIEFDVDNGEMVEHVKVTQYPPRYVTAFQGERGRNYYAGEESGPSANHNNFSLFRITTLVNNADVTIEDVVCLIGDPQNRNEAGQSANTRTGYDASTNMLISPDFIIASQNGVTLTRRLSGVTSSGETRCYNYYEQDYGPSRSKGGRWRLPTRAEIAYIDALQDNPNSAVKRLLEGEAYWSAQRYYYYNFNMTPGRWYTTTSTTSAAHIRCVYDMYKIVTP